MSRTSELRSLIRKHETATQMVRSECGELLSKVAPDDQEMILNLVSAFAVNAGQEEPTVLLLSYLSHKGKFDVDKLIYRLETSELVDKTAYEVTRKMHEKVKAKAFTPREFANAVEEMCFLVALNTQ